MLWFPSLIALFFAVLGAVFVRMGIRDWRRCRTWPSVTAVVTGVRVVSGGDDGPTKAPVVRFTVPDGRVVDTTTATNANVGVPRVGSSVVVHYNEDDPRQIVLDRLAFNGCGLLGGGALFLAVGLGLLYAFTFLRS